MNTSRGPATNSNKRLRLAFQFSDPGVSPGSEWVAGFYYLRNCLNALAALPEEFAPEVYALVPAGSEERLLFRGASEPVWLRIVEISAEQNVAALMPRLLRSLNIDVVFPVTALPSAAVPCASIGWIPDFQHNHYPQFFDSQELENRRIHYAFLAGYCDRVVCSSSQVMADFRATYPDVGDKGELLRFRVTLPPDVIGQSPAATLSRLGLGGRVYAYLPNQFWVHKNHRTVFEAWRTVIAEQPDLLLVCSGALRDYRAPNHYAELEQFLEESGLEHSVLRLGALKREDQLQIMRGATLVIQPSLFEGWSTSVEEARAFGKPLVLSDIPVHREQCGPDAVYFASNDASELARKMLEGLRQLPHGHDARREVTALAKNERAVQTFGKALLGVAERAHGYRVAHRTCSASHQLELSLTLSLRQRLSEVESDRAESERDRAKRLDDVHQLEELLAESERDRAKRRDDVHQLEALLAESERDRAKRRDDVHQLEELLAESEQDRAKRLDDVHRLEELLAESEQDRAKRLDDVQALDELLRQSEQKCPAPEVVVER